jgi:hypothetical protein
MQRDRVQPLGGSFFSLGGLEEMRALSVAVCSVRSSGCTAALEKTHGLQACVLHHASSLLALRRGCAAERQLLLRMPRLAAPRSAVRWYAGRRPPRGLDAGRGPLPWAHGRPAGAYRGSGSSCSGGTGVAAEMGTRAARALGIS